MKATLQMGCAALVIGWLGFGSAAQAQLGQFSTRFGNSSKRVAIGVVQGRVSIVEQRISDGSCAIQRISTGAMLSQHVNFNTGNGNNLVRMVTLDWNSSLCGFSIQPIPLGSPNRVAVLGGTGNDLIIVSQFGLGDGLGGDDVVIGLDSFGWISGGDGNDWIIQTGDEGFSSQVIGGFGNDVLCDLADGSQGIGGDGTDSGFNLTLPRPGQVASIERQANGTDCQNVAFAAVVGIGF